MKSAPNPFVQRTRDSRLGHSDVGGAAPQIIVKTRLRLLSFSCLVVNKRKTRSFTQELCA